MTTSIPKQEESIALNNATYLVADAYRFVVGIDTHAATHTYAVLDRLGRLLDCQAFPTSAVGIDRAVAWIGRRTAGDLDGTLISAEGTGTYGAVLSSRLDGLGYRVTEAPTPRRDRASGKDDKLDAERAARATLAMPIDRLRDRRRAGEDGSREALQVLITAREQTSSERTRAINALTALLRGHDLGLDARSSLTSTQIKEVAGWRTRVSETVGTATARARAVRLARRIIDLDVELRDNHRQLKELVQDQAPVLLEQQGVGPVVAAVVLATWSHPGRIKSAAAFSAIAGVAPIPASSGNTQRHRLNRGGDRRLNRALHTIVLTRMRCDPITRAYVQRRTAEGKTIREIRRSLKRYAARQLYRTLNHA